MKFLIGTDLMGRFVHFSGPYPVKLYDAHIYIDKVLPYMEPWEYWYSEPLLSGWVMGTLPLRLKSWLHSPARS